MSSQVRLILILLGLLGVLSALLFSYGWNADWYFKGAYSNVVRPRQIQEQAMEEARKRANMPPSPPPSQQPRPIGLTEREIEKQHGHRYSTF